MGTKGRCTESVNILPNELKEQECQVGLTAGLFPREQHRISTGYQINGKISVNTISQQQAY